MSTSQRKSETETKTSGLVRSANLWDVMVVRSCTATFVRCRCPLGHQCVPTDRCSHWTAISGDQWPHDVRLSDIEARFTCEACGTRGADLRPNFHWEQEARQASAHKERSPQF